MKTQLQRTLQSGGESLRLWLFVNFMLLCSPVAIRDKETLSLYSGIEFRQTGKFKTLNPMNGPFFFLRTPLSAWE
jgi:hypothetical protein